MENKIVRALGSIVIALTLVAIPFLCGFLLFTYPNWAYDWITFLKVIMITLTLGIIFAVSEIIYAVSE